MNVPKKPIEPGDFVGVVWGGDKPNPRTGLIGRLVDLILGVRMTPGSNQFVAVHRNGRLYSSPDGVTWTMQSTPTECNKCLS